MRLRMLVGVGGVGALSLAASLLVPASVSASPVQTGTLGELVAVDWAGRAGLRVAKTTTWSAAPVDYNRDGAQDVLINYHIRRPAKLWRNGGAGRYRRVARRAWRNAHGRYIDRHNCAWADVDRNGRPDAYCSAGRTNANLVKTGRDNELWLQSRRGRFREAGTRWGVGDVCGRGRKVVFLDANGDRWPDLFLGNNTPRRVPDPCNRSSALPDEGSKIFLNVRGRGFRQARRFFDYGPGPGSRCAEVLDFDGDGWDDLFTCRDQGTLPRLYRNHQGRGFSDVTSRHTFTRRVTDATVADLDGDLDPDIVSSNYGGFSYQLNTNGQFGPPSTIAQAAVGRGWGVAVGDADGDGDGDVYGMVARGLRRNPDDRVWLNDALSFTGVRVPHAGGAADDVIALDPRGDGRAAFLVLNGHNKLRSGAIQLIRVIRR